MEISQLKLDNKKPEQVWFFIVRKLCANFMIFSVNAGFESDQHPQRSTSAQQESLYAEPILAATNRR